MLLLARGIPFSAKSFSILMIFLTALFFFSREKSRSKGATLYAGMMVGNNLHDLDRNSLNPIFCTTAESLRVLSWWKELRHGLIVRSRMEWSENSKTLEKDGYFLVGGLRDWLHLLNVVVPLECDYFSFRTGTLHCGVSNLLQFLLQDMMDRSIPLRILLLRAFLRISKTYGLLFYWLIPDAMFGACF